MGADAPEPTYFDAGGLKYQYFDGVNFYKGGNMTYEDGQFIKHPKEGDICIVAANPDYTGTELVIPATVKYNGKDIKVVGIAPEAFKGNQSITSVTFPNTFPVSYTDNHYSAPPKYSEDLCGKNMFAGCSNLTKVVFSDGMKYFKAETPFKDCPIAEVSIPETLTKFDGFLEYSAVETIDIPEWVTTISFSYCSKLKEIPALLGMTEVPQDCFSHCTSLVDVTLPANATKISARALKGCTAMKTLIVPDKVQVMGQEAVAYCTSLEKVILGSSVNEFASVVFNGSTAIKDVYFIPKTAPHFYELGNPTATAATANIFPQEVMENAVAYVPAGSKSSYTSQGWFKFKNVNEEVLTGIGDISIEATEAKPEYFDLKGSRVDPDCIVPGIYILREGDTAQKIYIR